MAHTIDDIDQAQLARLAELVSDYQYTIVYDDSPRRSEHIDALARMIIELADELGVAPFASLSTEAA